MTSIKKQKKIETLAKIKKDLQNSQATYFVDYRGLTVSQVSELREKLKGVGAKMQVAKNTILKRALESLKLKVENDEFLSGPTATVFSFEDQMAPLKVLATFSKSFGIPEFKVGFLDHDFLEKERLERLSALPEKNVLLSQVVGQISAPLYGLLGILRANLFNLVFALEQLKTKKLSNPEGF